jgi:hypothetical protein
MSPIKRCLGALAVAMYVLPLSTSLLTNAVHDAYHLGEFLEHGSVEVADLAQPETGDFAHAHGGAEHSHGATTDALLGAADRRDEPDEEHHAPALELVGHLPAHNVLFESAGAEDTSRSGYPASAVQASRTPPPLPPPRV